ncbi:hypothetical protein D3C86_1907770 [compost metagenome]
MRRIQLNRLAQIVKRLFQRLIRQAVHQIKIKAPQPQTGCQMRCPLRFSRPVNAAQTFKFWLAKALHTDGNTVDPGTLVIDKTIGLNGARIRFHGNFCICCQIQTRTHAVQQRLHRRARE